jgi:hypothetical protein
MAWHFVGNTLRDGRPVPKDGEWLKHKGDIRMCAEELHASVHPMDALKYASGPILCRVECAGTIVHGDDKLVCSERRIVARMDATDMLRYFARMQALSVVHLWDAPDVVLDYLMIGDESIRAAVEAEAWEAAWAATRATAWEAAIAAAAAARDEAWEAAKTAAKAAAWAAAWTDFRDLVYECFGVRS